MFNLQFVCQVLFHSFIGLFLFFGTRQSKILFALLVLLFGYFGKAQKNIETQSLVWYGYSLNFKLSGRWSIQHSLENRQFWFPDRQHQLINVNKVTYDFKNGLKAAPGITFFQLTLPQDPFAEDVNRIWEIRPHVEANYDSKLSKKIKLQNRGMWEWRYFENENGNFAFRNYRYRHRLQLAYRLNPEWQFRAYNELMVNIGGNVVNNTFDQNRLGFAAKRFLAKGFAVEVGYLNWYQQQSTGNDFFNRHIVTFNLSKNLDFSRKEVSNQNHLPLNQNL